MSAAPRPARTLRSSASSRAALLKRRHQPGLQRETACRLCGHARLRRAGAVRAGGAAHGMRCDDTARSSGGPRAAAHGQSRRRIREVAGIACHPVARSCAAIRRSCTDTASAGGLAAGGHHRGGLWADPAARAAATAAPGLSEHHASLLPRWRGAAPIQRALQAGDATTGVSIMQMDEGLDTGAVLAERALPIAVDDTAGTLHDRLAGLGASLLLETLMICRPARPHSTASGHFGRELCGQARQKRGAHCLARLGVADRPAEIRAFNPPGPSPEATLHGENVKLLLSRVAQGPPAVLQAGPPGTVLGLREDAMQVSCGQGVLELLQLQRPGRRPVTAREFLNAERHTQ